MSELACPACGAPNSDLNPRCGRCGAPLPDESQRSAWAVDPAMAATVVGSGARSAADTVPTAEVQAAPGARLGRFTVLEELGRGTMGVVVKAHDPELDRTVAIKVLRSEALGPLGAAEARERLIREAKAMAKVSHRNVVSVHEVDVASGQVLVVMEHIRGRNLRAWMRERPRTPEEIREVFLQAGRGLAEVHRLGLVHRDFKPDNIMVGADGRVCVTDFGLVGLVREPAGARGGAQVDSQVITETTAAAGSLLLEPASTGTGMLMGTPAYMAPEQHRLQRAGAPADQFAFCVSLYEALHGERPFAGQGYEAIRESVMAGAVRPAPGGAAVPAWLRRIALRGLALEPAGRYPSMDALLADLEKDPRVARRRVLLGATAAALVAAAGYGALRSGALLCAGGQDRLAGVWDPPVKASVEKAFLATGRPYAADMYRRVAKALDERAAAWVSMYRDSCEATHVRREQSAQLLDARTGCLERRRTELAALAAQLGSGLGAEVLNGALEAAYALPRLDACANRDALLAAVPLPSDPEALARIGAAREALAKAQAQLRTSRFKEGLETVKAVQEDVKAADYAPLTAEHLSLRGSLEQELDQAAAAEETLRLAAVEAAKARNDALLAEIWTLAIEVIGNKRTRPAEALALEGPAEGAVERAGGSPFLRGRLLANVSSVLHRKGDDPHALEVARRAVAILDQAPGGESPDLALALGAQGNALFSMRRMEEARTSYQRALDIQERIFGGTHSLVASALHSMAKVYGAAGQLEKALPPSQRELAIYEELLGPDSTKVADSLSNQGLILTDLGQYDEALQAHRRALAIREKTYDGDHRSIAAALQNLAYTLQTQDKHAEALPYLKRGLEMNERILGPEHRTVGRKHHGLGQALCEIGQREEGMRELQRALAIFETLDGKDGVEVMELLINLGECQLKGKQVAQARATLERALSIASARAADVDPTYVAALEFLMAKALWPAPADQPRALALAKQARDGFVKAGRGNDPRLAEVEAWLQAHLTARSR